MEAEELKRLHDEKERERLETVSEIGPEYEWDGLRRRRTTINSQMSRRTASPTPFTPHQAREPFPAPPRTPHLPLGMSYMPTAEEMEEEERRRQASPSLLSSIAGTIRGRGRSIILPGHPDFHAENSPSKKNTQSPMRPVQLTDIALPSQKLGGEASPYGTTREHAYGLPDSLRNQRTEYGGASAALARSAASIASASSTGQRIHFAEDEANSLAPPTPPPHRDSQSARRQFSFQNVFRRHQADGSQELPRSPPSHHTKPPSRSGMGSRGYSQPQVKNATEEERAGLVKGDSNTTPALPRSDSEFYEEDEDDTDPDSYLDDKRAERSYGRGITGTSPPEIDYDAASRRKWDHSRNNSSHKKPKDPPGTNPRSPPRSRTPPGGGRGAGSYY